MASSDRKKENLNILEEIYHEGSLSKSEKASAKGGFWNSQNIERLLSGAIVVFSLAAISLGFFQLKYNIRKNFLVKSGEENQGRQYDPNDLLGLKYKDTDQDGLSDYDELNIYHTSPYLQDTDSDGLLDKDEVASGNDPNCPSGQDCFRGDGDLIQGEAGTSLIGSNISTMPDAPNLFLANPDDSEQIRGLLEQSGINRDELDQISDQELMEIYQEVISGQGIEPDSTAGQPASSDTGDLDRIKNLSSEEIRELLLQKGMDKDVLDQINDKDLMNLVNETLLGGNY